MHLRGLLLLTATLWSGTAFGAGDYAQSRAKMLEAYQAGNFVLMRQFAHDALEARPGFPGGLFNLALAQALGKDPAAALATLNRLAAMQVDFGAEGMQEFSALAALPGWPGYLQRVQDLRQPVGKPVKAIELTQGDFIPEGIALAYDGTAYLGSIRHGSLVRLREDNSPETISTPSSSGHWSVMGIHLDTQGQLWMASSALAQLEELAPEQAGQSGLFRLNPDKGQVTHRAVLPADGREHVLGDLAIADSGMVYTTDSLTGMVYEYQTTSGKFTPLVDEGVFQSPQGLVLDATQQNLYLADYNYGIYRLDLDTRRVDKLIAPEDVSLHGVDGLYRHGKDLIAIQNGIRPHRVARWRLDESGLKILSAEILAMNLPEFDEPTLGAIHQDHFYFVANSHWNRFTRDNSLPDDLRGPVILSLPLKP